MGVPFEPTKSGRAGKKLDRSELMRVFDQVGILSRTSGADVGGLMVNQTGGGIGIADLTPPDIWIRPTDAATTGARAWEQIYQSSGGTWAAVPGGMTGTTTNIPAYDVQARAIPTNTPSRAWLDESQTFFLFDGGAVSGGGSGITVEDDSGTPSYTSITTLQVATASAISNPSAGVARILDASATVGGLLSDGTQSIKGAKTFVDKPTADGYYATTGSAQTRYFNDGVHNITPVGSYDAWIGFYEDSPMVFLHETVQIGSPYNYIRSSLSVTDPTSGTPTVADRKIGAWATVSGLVFCGGLYVSGSLSVTPDALPYTSATSDPTILHIDTGKVGIHKNTSSGNVFFAYNDGGTIKKVQLT